MTNDVYNPATKQPVVHPDDWEMDAWHDEPPTEEVFKVPLDPWLRHTVLGLVDLPMIFFLFMLTGLDWKFAAGVILWWLTRILRNGIKALP